MRRLIGEFKLTLWLVLFVCSCSALAQESYRSVRLPNAEILDESAVRAIVESSAPPDQILLLIHGYDMGAEESGRKFEELSRTLRSELKPREVLILGLQWDSGGHSILNPLGDYFDTLQRARTLGRGPLRQILIGLQEEHPEVPITVLAHSMGCEVTLAAVAPEINYTEQPPTGPTYQANQGVRLAFATFAGSDLDYDIWHKSGSAAMNWFNRVGLTWITVSAPATQGDKVLSFRTRLRGKAAGSLMPLMTEQQLDTVLPSRKLTLDDKDVPVDHELDSYFRPARVKRLVETLLFLTDLGDEPPELSAIQAALDAPNELPPLKKLLDSPHAGAAFVALWRVEHLLCGSSAHLADRTLEKAVLLLADHPKAIWALQDHSECKTLHHALFPTEQTMRRAGAPYRSRPPRYRTPGRP